MASAHSTWKEYVVDFNKRILPWLINLSPYLATRYLYAVTTQKWLKLKSPKDFNEKLEWLKLYWPHPLVTQCADKYEVKKYVADRGCPEILNELLGVYGDVSEIDWPNLPSEFVLKTTNAGGTNIICSNKDLLKKEEVFGKLEKWLKMDYGKIFAEPHYSKMKPRIIAEKYLGLKDGTLPIDYRFYCFNGEPKMILLSLDRAIGLKCMFVDMDWNKMDGIAKSDDERFLDVSKPLKPECFDDLVRYSRILSEPFPFVRIDFYVFDGKPILGEMTFTPHACMATFQTQESLERMGAWINLPQKYE